MLYNTGTIAINGNTATGTGTNWTAPASQVRAGQTIIVMSNTVQLFQISAVNSATSMTVTPAASPALSGQKYGILVSDNISVDGLAQAMSQLIKEYDENIGAWETFATTSANQTITVTINGASVNIPGIGALARKGTNSDITELKGLTTALSIAQGGTGATTAEGSRTNLGLGSSATRSALDSEIVTNSDTSQIPSLKALGLGYARHIDNFSNTNMLGFGRFTSQTANNPANTNGVGGQLQYDGGPSTAWFVWTNDGQAYIQTNHMQGATYQWKKVYTTANTIIASDGSIKAASPVVKVYSDGTYQTNDESEGCTVTRLSLGEYFIEGSEGLNSDAAWGGIDGGFDIPTDRNKQPLLWRDYHVHADGSVLVKTYHRTHSTAPEFARNEIQGINDGDPIDIPSDQFVSVRVQMPQESI
ncbi:phage tail protein [Enterobacter ludwigii]|uniref:phage tail fiber protein n=1 Tax=Enterobacter ludwigii TaxID=299767 RepID=UPI002075A7D8|nr:phage tail protein [Enterobacter ludwigii]MCM7368540.1 phage tail protein [Enterobacter ludwigii]MDW5476439.1 phage tail protein [Enterobacter ludwigii]WLK79666.1 phage tail protein [Enterobacter ludwigii]